MYEATSRFGHGAAGDAVSETLALTRAFVAILLGDRLGPLTAIQRDFLETIAGKIDRLQPVSTDHAVPAGACDAATIGSIESVAASVPGKGGFLHENAD